MLKDRGIFERHGTCGEGEGGGCEVTHDEGKRDALICGWRFIYF